MTELDTKKHMTGVRVDLREALRYAGVPEPDERLLSQMGGIAASLQLSPKSVWRCFTLRHEPEGVLLVESGILLKGNSAKKMLSACHHAVLTACTLGASFDALLRREQARDMETAVLTDACGSALIEQVCDDMEKEIAGRFPECFLTDRFSPGYGDLPLELQPKILSALDAARRTGITLLPSNLMNPSKSVTAVIGIADHPQPARIRGCAYCRMQNKCSLHKGGRTCDQP